MVFNSRSIIYSLLFSFLHLTVSYSQKSNKQHGGDSMLIVNVEMNLQKAQQLRNEDIRQSLELTTRALKDAELLQDKMLIAEAKLAIGKCYDHLGVSGKALEHLNEALINFRSLGEEKKAIETLLYIGNIYRFANEYTLALPYFQEVKHYAESNSDTTLLIKSLISIGGVYGNTAKLDSAITLFKEAHMLTKGTSLVEEEIQSLYYIGDATLFSGRPSEALTILHQLEASYNVEESSPKNLPGIYNSITKAYIETKNLKAAREYSYFTHLALQKYPRLQQFSLYYWYRFKIDSLEGNYYSALENFYKFKLVNDSITNTNFKKQLANFETLYDLERKEHQIERLTLDNQLKDIKIKQRLIINYGLGALAFLFIIFIIQFYRSRKKISEKKQLT
jgi:tetratricopeptide (TPR) repeat protein